MLSIIWSIVVGRIPFGCEGKPGRETACDTENSSKSFRISRMMCLGGSNSGTLRYGQLNGHHFFYSYVQFDEVDCLLGVTRFPCRRVLRSWILPSPVKALETATFVTCCISASSDFGCKSSCDRNQRIYYLPERGLVTAPVWPKRYLFRCYS